MVVKSAETDGVKAVWSSGVHSLAIKDDGSLWAWGNNDYGQFGNGTEISRTSPIKIMDNVTAVSAGAAYTLAVKADGTLWAWGGNASNQLGDGTKTNKRSPVKIMDNVLTISSGDYHNFAIKKDGSLWAWGSNIFGQLGDGTTDNRPSPVKVMDNVAAVSTGETHTMAIKTDGSLWAWGWNIGGHLGDGSDRKYDDAYKSPPIKIMDNVAAVSVGGEHTLATKTDGSLWAWGKNSSGQLGDGTTTTGPSPVKIMDNVTVAFGGGGISFAIKTDGTLWGWGSIANPMNDAGVITYSKILSPVKIMDNVATVGAGYGSYALVKTDGTLWTWGDTTLPLGDGTTVPRNTPAKIMDGVKLPSNATLTAPPTSTGGVSAKPTASTVLVNGKNIAFGAYNIAGNNYFKLRDLALAINGTGKQFSVGWDGANNAISLTSGISYTPEGSELQANTGGNKNAVPTKSKIFLDGKEVSFEAYNIDGSNYFKLRDIGKAFNFGVDWDEAKNTIVIDTNRGYTE